MANFPNHVLMGDNQLIDIREKEAQYRYGNPSKVRMEIRYGSDNTVYETPR